MKKNKGLKGCFNNNIFLEIAQNKTNNVNDYKNCTVRHFLIQNNNIISMIQFFFISDIQHIQESSETLIASKFLV